MKRRTKALIFIILVALILAVSFSPRLRLKAKSILTGSSSGLSVHLENFGHRIKNSFSFVTNIGNLKKQNENLSQQIISLKVDSSQIEELENENALLKRELGFIAPENKASLVPAKIIEADPATFSDNIVIDKGTDDGVKNGQAVVSSGVFIGTVKQALAQTSTVLLITSKDSIVQAMLQNSRAKGVLRGGISGLYLDDITTDTEYKTGENVVTSGLGGGVPAGLLIGTAGKLESSQSSIFKTISVDGAVNIANLELVFVQK